MYLISKTPTREEVNVTEVKKNHRLKEKKIR